MKIRSSVFSTLAVLAQFLCFPVHAQTAPAALPITNPGFFAVSVSDLQASVAWYSRVLGLDEVFRVEAPNGATAVIVGRDGMVVELIAFPGSAAAVGRGGTDHRFETQGLVKAGMVVTDADAWHRALARAGVRLDTTVVVDERLRARTFVFRDIDENRVQVIQYCGTGCN